VAIEPIQGGNESGISKVKEKKTAKPTRVESPTVGRLGKKSRTYPLKKQSPFIPKGKEALLNRNGLIWRITPTPEKQGNGARNPKNRKQVPFRRGCGHGAALTKSFAQKKKRGGKKRKGGGMRR